MYKLDKETTIKLIELTEQNKLNESIWKHINKWSLMLNTKALDQVIALLVTDVPNKDIIIRHLTSTDMDKYLRKDKVNANDYIANLLNFLAFNQDIEEDDKMLTTILMYGNYDKDELEKTIYLSCVEDLFDETSLIPSRFDKKIITNKNFSIEALKNATLFYSYNIEKIKADNNLHTEWLVALLFNNEDKFNTHMNLVEHPKLKDNNEIKKLIENTISNCKDNNQLIKYLKLFETSIEFLLLTNNIHLLTILNKNMEKNCPKEEMILYLNHAIKLITNNTELLDENNNYLLTSLFSSIMNENGLTHRVLINDFDINKDKAAIKQLLAFNPLQATAVKSYLHMPILKNVTYLEQLKEMEPNEIKLSIASHLKKELKQRRQPNRPKNNIINTETLKFISDNNNLETLREFKKVLQGNTTEVEGLKNPYKKEME